MRSFINTPRTGVSCKKNYYPTNQFIVRFGRLIGHLDIRTGLEKACKNAGIDYGRSRQDGFVFHAPKWAPSLQVLTKLLTKHHKW